MNWFIALGNALSSPLDNVVSFLFAWALVFIGLYFAHELFVYLGEMLDAAKEEVQKKATKDREEQDAAKMEKIKQADKVKERSDERKKAREAGEQTSSSENVASEQREETLAEKNEREIRKHFPEN